MMIIDLQLGARATSSAANSPTRIMDKQSSPPSLDCQVSKDYIYIYVYYIYVGIRPISYWYLSLAPVEIVVAAICVPNICSLVLHMPQFCMPPSCFLFRKWTLDICRSIVEHKYPVQRCPRGIPSIEALNSAPSGNMASIRTYILYISKRVFRVSHATCNALKASSV